MKEEIIEKLKILSNNNKDIYSTIVFGSIKAKDIFSDIDVFFFTKNPKKYLSGDQSWLLEIGTPISKLDIINPIENVMISRVMLENYMTLDIIPVDYSEFKKATLYFALNKYNLTSIIPNKIKTSIDTGLRTFYHYIRNEHSIIYDKGNVTAIVDKISNHFNEKQHCEFLYQVNKEKFYQNYNEFWQLAFKTIGMVVRNELYYGITIYDNILKKRLIELIEWYTFSFESKSNLHYKGKSVQNWANENINNELRKIFAFENQQNSYRSIVNSINLYQELSHQIIEKYNFSKNEMLENKIEAIINEFKNKI
ncbi:aminoglycoside 6-adenylyltransferase [Flavobacterium sp. P4023]|uniref:Aminoglycoside 6-adenylyltransferase n=1 Tax=Flavobacterium flabelliforme TaxID=2816119 RepID=A0ABS5CTX3_9FLAO|nr:aminoglycoside 6-adenylyltransferase [Flavobacterium flabelliforme]MBP4142050.1 aminoglycoside 6-adenylyltransferase [Flavobacterium flabelliforme]